MTVTPLHQDRAVDADLFRALLRRHAAAVVVITAPGAPPRTPVWVDRQGNIGWQASGIQPIRRNWSGILPVPGDGRYEWAGFRDMDELPVASNPDPRS